jgi:hypothetical protein
MSKTQKKGKSLSLTKAIVPVRLEASEFDAVIALIEVSRIRAISAVNKELIDLYWSIDEHRSQKIAAEDWGQADAEPPAIESPQSEPAKQRKGRKK